MDLERGLLIPQGLALIVAGGIALLAVLAVAPNGDTVDITARTTAEWHPILSKWTLAKPDVSVKESKIVNFGSLFRNAASLTSPSHPLVFTLERADAAPYTLHQTTGKGSWSGSTHTESVVFRKVPPGDYVIRAQILEGDQVLAEESVAIRLQELQGGS